MKKKITQLACAVLIFSICALSLIATILFIQALGPVLWSERGAGWAQAIGATVGLCVAVYVPAKQKKDSEEAEERRRIDAARRVCLAFLDELKALQTNIQGENIQKLLAIQDGEFFNVRIPEPKNRFPVFSAYIGRITEIDNPNIRNLVIAAYESAHALMEAGFLNNELLYQHGEHCILNKENPDSLNGQFVNFQREQLQSLCRQMQALAKLSIERVEKAIKLLEVEV